MKAIKLFAMAVGFVASSAHAADWKLVTMSDTHYAFVDVSSIVPVKTNRKAWVMWSEIEEEGKKIDATQPITRSSKVLTHFNCAERSTANAQKTDYTDTGGNGRTNGSVKNVVVASSFDEVVPDTVGEYIFNFVCAKQLK